MSDKNLHMTHLEDLIFTDGIEGTRKAIFFLKDLRKMLAGNSKPGNTISLKADGSPSLFVGVDPEDGKFFVAKKSLFAKTPKMYKTQSDIDADLTGDLATKFTIALRELSKIGITSGVYQGDIMFTQSDVKVETIQGEKFFTFHPNTLVYAVPVDSMLGRKISKAEIGIVFHTTYTGKTIQTMKAQFGLPIVSKFKSATSVWMDDAVYKDVSGKALFTKEETAQFDTLLSNIGKVFQKVNGEAFRSIVNDEELKQKTMTFVNTYVRAGKSFPSPQIMARELGIYLTDWYLKEINKKSTPAGKKTWEDRRDVLVNKILLHNDQLISLFSMMQMIADAKKMVIDQFNKIEGLNVFLKTKDGFIPTKQEGFVAIDHLSGGAVKLVDRLEFSRANFSPDVLKGWS